MSRRKNSGHRRVLFAGPDDVRNREIFHVAAEHAREAGMPLLWAEDEAALSEERHYYGQFYYPLVIVSPLQDGDTDDWLRILAALAYLDAGFLMFFCERPSCFPGVPASSPAGARVAGGHQGVSDPAAGPAPSAASRGTECGEREMTFVPPRERRPSGGVLFSCPSGAVCYRDSQVGGRTAAAVFALHAPGGAVIAAAERKGAGRARGGASSKPHALSRTASG